MDLTHFTPVEVVVSGRAYTYKAHTSMALKPRDLVVVDFGSKGLTCGVVESVGQVPVDPNAKFKYKWVVDSVNRTHYDAILAAEAEALKATDA